jgi:hypothetical protein
MIKNGAEIKAAAVKMPVCPSMILPHFLIIRSQAASSHQSWKRNDVSIENRVPEGSRQIIF